MEKWEAAKSWCDQRVGCPYIMGGTGQICTPAYRQARMAQYPAYAAKMKNNCPRLMGNADTCVSCRWCDPETGVGRQAYDCAQLSRRCMEFVEIPMVSGANSQWHQVAWAEKGPIEQMPRDKLCLVFRQEEGKMAHVGVYQGDGWVIHAKGHDYGVVREPVDSVKLTHYGIPAGLYTSKYEMPMLRAGDSNDYVKIMQRLLVQAGYTLKPTKSAADGCDGIFGADTEAALMAFQAEHGLTADGICGPGTWTSLENAAYNTTGTDAPEPETPETDADSTDAVTVPRAEWNAVKAAVMILYETVKKYDAVG